MTEQAESPERSYFRSTMIGDVDILELNSKTIKAGTMSDIKDTEVISPPAKRMKQARLPFVSLTNKQILSSDPSSQITKKPMLTDKSSPFFSSSGKARHVDKNTTPIKKADTPQAKKSGAMKVRKIGFSNEIAGKPCAPPEPEVSSSSEDTKPSEKECDSTVTMAGSSCTSTASPKKVSKSASLDRFIQSTQQPQVSTSAIIDLTDADDEMEDDDDFETPKSLTKKSKAEKRKRESPTRSPAKSTTDATTEITETPQEGDAAVNTSVSSISSLEQTSSDEESSSEEEEEEEEKDSNRSISDGKDKEDTLMEAVEKVLEEEERKTALEKNHEEKPVKMPPQPVTPSNVMKPIKKTPLSAKALQRLKEQEAKREEKQRQREEKKRKLEEENEMKKRQKLEQRRAKEEEKEAQRKQKVEEKKKKEMEKQLKKEKEEQERMEKKKAKEEERQKKQEEIEAKQEEKKKRQEERQKLEEEKKQKEEAELLKKAKQSQMFKSFFNVQTQAPVKKPEFKGWFAPFEVKTDMVLAPCSRVDPKDLDLEQVDKHLETPSTGSLYLDELKSSRFKPRKNGRTPGPARPAQEKPAQESMDIDAPSTSAEDSKKKSKMKKPEGIKMKLVQFHENYRPAYYGTWQKKTSVITGRNPFKKDEDTFDYEFDSDDEWEEPGESLSHSEGEDEDGDGDDDDDEEDGFFVPHGYLSAGEGGEDEEDTDNLKARQAAKARAWENELKRRCEALKPMIITFIQVASTNKTRQDEKKKLEAYAAMPLTNLPIATSFTKREKAKVGEESTNATQGEGAAMAQQKLAGGVGNKLKPVPEEAMPELLRLVHGNMAGIKSLIREFRDYWRRKQHRLETTSPGALAACPDGSPSVASGDQGVPVAPRESPLGEARAAVTPVQNTSPSPVPGSTPSPQYLDHIDHVISKRQLDLKINSIAVRERRPQHFKRICWYVHDRILEKYNLTDLPVPTAWVNGVGVRDGQASPLPPTNIASKPAATVPKPAVNKPVVTKVPNLHEGNSTVSSLLKASKEQAALANQHIFIPSNTMPSAFNKVVGMSSASGTVHLPGATHFQSTPSIGYIPPESTLLRPGLAPFQLVPLQMQQAISPAAFNMSNLLQQAAASSLLANMQQTSALGSTLVQPPNTNGAQKNIPGVAKDIDSQNSIPQDLTGVKQRHSAPILKPTIRSPPPGGPKSTSSPPGRSSGSSGGVPLLPSVKKVSPQRLDTAIAKLYESNALLREKEKTNPAPAPVKKIKTIASFFNAGNPKKSENKSQEIPSETPKE